jgi:hypothetical protein
MIRVYIFARFRLVVSVVTLAVVGVERNFTMQSFPFAF